MTYWIKKTKQNKTKQNKTKTKKPSSFSGMIIRRNERTNKQTKLVGVSNDPSDKRPFGSISTQNKFYKSGQWCIGTSTVIFLDMELRGFFENKLFALFGIDYYITFWWTCLLTCMSMSIENEIAPTSPALATRNRSLVEFQLGIMQLGPAFPVALTVLLQKASFSPGGGGGAVKYEVDTGVRPTLQQAGAFGESTGSKNEGSLGESMIFGIQ